MPEERSLEGDVAIVTGAGRNIGRAISETFAEHGARVAVADLDGDGDLEVVFSEGDSPTYGSHPGRVAWFDPPDWEPTFLREDLFCPHSLQVADFSGNGWPDIYVAEMGLGTNDASQHILFLNQGEGEFEERVIATGVETHEAKAADLTGTGVPDIVGKSYTPDHHVDVWHNELRDDEP
jgi:NAD(P)-dependent dehydrogenase (short-subunit alcohol dehydrogenase family)